MKKLMRTVCAGVLLAAALTVPVFAADFTDCASRLNGMNLFKGTGHDYALDRAPTRAEAAVMLVRLLGKEQEAAELSYTAPFEDLSRWQEPYVQYLYDNGLTTGATESEFQPEEKCTAQMYAAFLLRALGYTEEDFTYANAIPFATQIGLYSDLTVDADNFLRDHVAATSYTALSLTPKGEKGTMLDVLVREGAVTEGAAKQYQERFNDYNNYRNATGKMKELTAMSLNHELTLKTDSISIRSAEDIKVTFKTPAKLSARKYTLSAQGAKDKVINTETYLADGMYYLLQNGIANCHRLSDEQFRKMISEYYVVPIALVAEIKNEGAIYSITYNHAGVSRLGGILDMITSAVGDLNDLKVSNITVKQDINDGLITSQRLKMEFQSKALTGSVESVMLLNGTNDEVSIVPPSNLDKYKLLKYYK